ncbi:MAG: ROK family protein [Nitrospirae bacterium]|nr:MAG: ROK family protein [Nitrospirota bacterium]
MKQAIVADIGGTNIRASLVTSSGEIVQKLKEPNTKEPLQTLYKLIDGLVAGHEADLSGIGIAVAGLIDSKSGTVLQSPNISSLNGINLKQETAQKYNALVVVENDANAAAFGEKWKGTGKKFENFVMLTLGTGIGGGIITSGKLLPVAAEIGHISINSNGRPCACGNIGCLETYASATAIVGNAILEIEKGTESILKSSYKGNFYKITAEDIYKAAIDGDSMARAVVREAGKHLGTGIASIINIMSPEAIILTGGLLGAWNIYIEAAINEAAKRALKELYNKVSIVPSELADDAGMIGAAGLVFEQAEQYRASN